MFSDIFTIGPFLIIPIAILAIIGGITGAKAARKRGEEMFGLAQRLNLDFSAEPVPGIAEQYQFLKKLGKGDNRYAYNVLGGKYQNNDILAFDFHYQVTTSDKNGTHTTHYRFSFFILQLTACFPDLTIRRENFLLKVAEAFGYEDIKFESAEFSKTFSVRSPDKKFAYDICNAQMMEYLLANRDLSIEIENQALALAFDTCLSPVEIEYNLQRLAQIRSLIPDYLFTQSA